MNSYRRSCYRPTFVKLSCICIALVAVGCSQQKVGVPDQPVLKVVGGDSVGWGRVQPGIITKVVRITNAGGATLNVSDVKPSCGCTTAPLDKKQLAPGDTGTIKISVDLTGHHGPQKKSVMISSNDPDHPVVALALTATIAEDLVAVPAFFPTTQGARVNKEYTSKIDIQNAGDSTVTVHPPVLTSGGDLLKVKFEPSTDFQLAPKANQRITAHIIPLKVTTINATATFRSSSTMMPTLAVPLAVQVSP